MKIELTPEQTTALERSFSAGDLHLVLIRFESGKSEMRTATLREISELQDNAMSGMSSVLSVRAFINATL